MKNISYIVLYRSLNGEEKGMRAKHVTKSLVCYQPTCCTIYDQEELKTYI